MASGVRSRRERAFLDNVPEDFLRVEAQPPPTSNFEQRASDGPEARFPTPQAQPALHPTITQYPPVAGYPAAVPITHLPATVHSPYPTVRGRVRMTVNDAQLAKNYGLTRMDPYCRIRIGHHVFETDTDVSGSKSPRWTKSFTFGVSTGIDSMYVELFDERTFAMDERIATAHFRFPETLYSGAGETVDWEIPLNGKQGEGKEGTLNVTVTYTPLSHPSSYQLTAYGNQPVSMVPATMPGAQVFYHGGYPPSYGPQAPGQPVPLQQSGARPRGSPLQIRQEQTAKDVSSLQDMFPSLEEDIIRSVYDANRGQMEPSISSLLQMIAGP